MLFFLSHPIQYFSPMLKVLSEKVKLNVYYYSDISIKGGKDAGFGQNVKWDVPLLEGYNSFFLNNWRKKQAMNNRMFNAFNPGVIKVLLKSNDKIVVINGWSYFTDWIILLPSPFLGKKIWLRCENPLNQELLRSGKVKLIKQLILKHFLFKLFIDKFLYIGSENKKFFEYYGVKEKSRLIFTPYSVDNDSLQKKYIELQPKREIIENKLGIQSNKKNILFTGKYISKKRPLDLLKAFKNLPQNNYNLIMVGEGELRKDMEIFILNNNLSNVYLTGFINQSEIWEYYAVSDVFVMCSGIGETWGLSVNEAMNFNLPVIVSSTCGSSFDLIVPGKNGFIFDEGDTSELSICILKATENKEITKSMGQQSAAIIKNYSISVVTDNILQAATCA